MQADPRQRPTAETPIVMFSALSSDDDIERARLAGANHLITKPFNLVGLGSVVKTFFPADVSTPAEIATPSDGRGDHQRVLGEVGASDSRAAPARRACASGGSSRTA